jgi:hypothetical protein
MPKGRRSLSLSPFRSLPERKAFEELSRLELIFATLPRVLREVIGNCVPVRFTVHDLQSFMPTKDARIQKVRYHYDGQGASPQEITAVNAKGEEVRLRLL